jgi:3-hydroxyisobutyrate dehydrogenase-like beta-hydroxyacid dehydrogenase
MVGGEEEAVSAVKPLFDVMGKNIVHLGPASSGTPCARNLVAVTIVFSSYLTPSSPSLQDNTQRW